MSSDNGGSGYLAAGTSAIGNAISRTANISFSSRVIWGNGGTQAEEMNTIQPAAKLQKENVLLCEENISDDQHLGNPSSETGTAGNMITSVVSSAASFSYNVAGGALNLAAVAVEGTSKGVVSVTSMVLENTSNAVRGVLRNTSSQQTQDGQDSAATAHIAEMPNMEGYAVDMDKVTEMQGEERTGCIQAHEEDVNEGHAASNQASNSETTQRFECGTHATLDAVQTDHNGTAYQDGTPHTCMQVDEYEGADNVDSKLGADAEEGRRHIRMTHTHQDSAEADNAAERSTNGFGVPHNTNETIPDNKRNENCQDHAKCHGNIEGSEADVAGNEKAKTHHADALPRGAESEVDVDKARRGKYEATVRELIDSEQRYTEGLEQLYTLFALPLESAARAGQHVMQQHHIQAVFGHVQHLVHVHRTLLEELREATADAAHTSIGTVMVRNVANLRVYGSYVRGYPGALEALRVSCDGEAGRHVRDFIELAEGVMQRDNEEGRLRYSSEGRHVDARRGGASRAYAMATLPSLLMSPVQRLPRYLLLFRQLVSLTDSAHADYAAITEAVVKLERLVAAVNEEGRDTAGLLCSLVTLNSRLRLGTDDGRPCAHFLQPHRRLLVEAQVRLIEQSNASHETASNNSCIDAERSTSGTAWGVLEGVGSVVGAVSGTAGYYGSALLGQTGASTLLKSMTGDWDARLLLVCNDIVVLCAGATQVRVTALTMQQSLRPVLLLQISRVMVLDAPSHKLKRGASARLSRGGTEGEEMKDNKEMTEVNANEVANVDIENDSDQKLKDGRTDRAAASGAREEGSQRQLTIRWLHAPPSIELVEGEVQWMSHDCPAGYGQGYMSWTEGSGEVLLEFSSKEDMDDARESLTRAADTARQRS